MSNRPELLINPRMAATISPPIMEVHGWLSEAKPRAGLPLIDVSQAAPGAPPPRALRQAIAEAALNDPAAHGYGPDLGFPPLRAALAENRAAKYGGAISPAAQACSRAAIAAVSPRGTRPSG